MMNKDHMMVRRGEIYFADLPMTTVGSEQGGPRPVLIVQNETGNRFSPTTIVVTLTKKIKNDIPVHILIDKENGLKYTSVAQCEQLKTIDKSRLKYRIGSVDDETLEKVSKALKTSLELF